MNHHRQKRGHGGRGRGDNRAYNARRRNTFTYSLPVPVPDKENMDQSDTKIKSDDRNQERRSYLNIAVEGCAHGALDQIYAAVEKESGSENSVDLLLCCGDFQALRNEADFDTLAVPNKYKSIGDFYKYYKGEKRVPVPTIFIGGNHEASGYMQELCYGGWAAEDVYFMGYAGVIQFGGVRIAGVSGIFKGYSHRMGHYEAPPYDDKDVRSVYHTRNVEVYRLAQLVEPIDIMISHDWPRGIEQHGNTQALIRKKSYFREEVQSNNLGSVAHEFLLNTLKPKWWFAAHLHVKFEASVMHNRNAMKQENQATSTSFIGLESECETGMNLSEQMTKFLSLDKCLPKRQFLQLLKIEKPYSEVSSIPKFQYDLEWLTVLRKTHHLTMNSKNRVQLPLHAMPASVEDKDETLNLMKSYYSVDDENDQKILDVPSSFVMTAPAYPDGLLQHGDGQMIGNPQTDAFLSMLGLKHIITLPYCKMKDQTLNDDNEIDLSDTLESDDGDKNCNKNDLNEIDLEESSEEEASQANLTKKVSSPIDIKKARTT